MVTPPCSLWALLQRVQEAGGQCGRGGQMPAGLQPDLRMRVSLCIICCSAHLGHIHSCCTSRDMQAGLRSAVRPWRCGGSTGGNRRQRRRLGLGGPAAGLPSGGRRGLHRRCTHGERLGQQKARSAVGPGDHEGPPALCGLPQGRSARLSRRDPTAAHRSGALLPS